MENNKTESEKVDKFDSGTLAVDKMSNEQLKAVVLELANENEELKKQTEQAQAAAEELKDKWMRSAAEFENYKKRTALSRIQGEEEGKTAVLLKILPIGDNLERALKMPIDEKTKEGLEMLSKSFKETLAKEEVTEINPVGEIFDPNYHEAVMQCPSEKEGDSGTVAEVFLKGYKLKERVIRYAQVKVVC